MRVAIEMQQLGPDFESGIIVAWLKAVGDPVAKGEAVVEVETEKIDAELEALEPGTLVEIVAKPGVEVAVGGVVGYLEIDD